MYKSYETLQFFGEILLNAVKASNKVSYVFELDIDLFYRIKKHQKLEGMSNRDFVLMLIDEKYKTKLLKEARMMDIEEL